MHAIRAVAEVCLFAACRLAWLSAHAELRTSGFSPEIGLLRRIGSQDLTLVRQGWRRRADDGDAVAPPLWPPGDRRHLRLDAW
jgi:hypothetical protein